jgi:beta-N-acetylhexosaminidase
MEGAAGQGSIVERVALALDAGCDLVLLCNCPQAVPEVIDSLEPFKDPAAQLRLMRLRGRAGPDLETLRQSPRWLKAKRSLDTLVATPPLKLEG